MGGFIMSFQWQIEENLNKLILRIFIILNRMTSTAQLTLMEAKMSNDVMLHTKLEEWIFFPFRYVHICL